MNLFARLSRSYLTILQIVALALLLMASAGTAVAAENNSQDNPCNLSKEDMSSLNVDP